MRSSWSGRLAASVMMLVSLGIAVTPKASVARPGLECHPEDFEEQNISPQDIVTGPDSDNAGRHMYFTGTRGVPSFIGRVDPVTLVQDAAFATDSLESRPHRIVVGPDDNIYWTQTDACRIGKLTLNPTPVVSESELFLTGEFPTGITVARRPSGNPTIWFTEQPDSDKIGETNTAFSFYTQHTLPSAPPGDPTDLEMDNDGTYVWYTSSAPTNKIGAIFLDDPDDPADNFAIGTNLVNPRGIASAPAPNDFLYFTEWGGHRISRLNPITREILQGTQLNDESHPSDIVVGDSGGTLYVFFTDPGLNKIGAYELLPSGGFGQPHHWNLPPNAQPKGITIDPDGIVWFTEANIDKIGRLDPVTGHIDQITIWAP